MIDRLINAVRLLGLSNELNIDFPKVKRFYNRILKSVHPDKNDGLDLGLGSVIDAYKLLDYYFNAVSTGKICQSCQLSNICEGSTCDDTHPVNSLETRGCVTPQYSIEDLTCKLYSSSLLIKDSSFELDHNFTLGDIFCSVCNTRVDSLKAPRFYFDLSKDSLDLYEGTPYVQCRCGQVLLIAIEATALGISEFDCDACSCTYRIADVK